MANKWAWLADRIKECGFNTNAAFAAAIGWAPARISEMVTDVEVYGGKVRNFPQDKIVVAANALRLPVNELMAYNNDIKNTIDLNSSNAPKTTIDPELLIDIMDAITEFLSENNLEMTRDQRKELIKHFCDSGLKENQRIKDVLSGMLAAGSNIFAKKAR